MKGDLRYLIALLATITLHYVIPFTLLRESRGFELFAFWTVLVAAFAIVTGIYVERRR